MSFGESRLKRRPGRCSLKYGIILLLIAMTDIGYEYCGLQKPDNDRHLFVLRGENQLSLRHIHCYEPNNADFIRCIGFRDYLNSHPKEALEYSELKKKLAKQFPDDRFAYSDAKYGFVKSIYDKLPNCVCSNNIV